MEYNSTRKRLLMPEYGRLVQQMVDAALEISDKAERQAYAELIVRVMAGLTPQVKASADYQCKLWDHLAYMAGYALDIDYPYEINRVADGQRPARLPYPGTAIRHRHYGHLLETLVDRLKEMPEGEERDELVRMAANRMKRNLADWKGTGHDDRMVEHDLAAYTDGVIAPDFSNCKLAYIPETRGAGNERNKHYRRNY